MSNLATTYSSLGKYNEALALQLEVLAFNRRVLPEDHPHIGRGTPSAAQRFLSRPLHFDALLCVVGRCRVGQARLRVPGRRLVR
jgi:hypothetical protein